LPTLKARGILCDIADAAMGMAFASTLGPNESFTTLEVKINFALYRALGGGWSMGTVPSTNESATKAWK